MTADEAHISGRDQPRVRAGDVPEQHVLRFYGVEGGAIRVVCDTCPERWARTFPGGKTEQQLLRDLPAMHYWPVTDDGGEGDGRGTRDPAQGQVQDRRGVKENQGQGKRKFWKLRRVQAPADRDPVPASEEIR